MLTSNIFSTDVTTGRLGLGLVCGELFIEKNKSGRGVFC